jgi:hypothetical protein
MSRSDRAFVSERRDKCWTGYIVNCRSDYSQRMIDAARFGISLAIVRSEISEPFAHTTMDSPADENRDSPNCPTHAQVREFLPADFEGRL